MDYLYITNQQEFDEALSLLTPGEPLAKDTETYALPEFGARGSALDPHTGRISILIIKARESIPLVFDIVWLEHNKVNLQPLHDVLLNAQYLLAQNAKFDLKMFQSTFGYMPSRVRDTMIMAKLIGNATGSKANMSSGYGYADLCRDLLDVHITGKKDLRESTWNIGFNSRNLDNEWWRSKIDYAANDVQYLFQLEDIMLPAILNPLPSSPLTNSEESDVWGLDMQEVFEREMAYIPLLAKREYEGMPASRAMFNQLQIGAQQELNAVACYLSEAFKLDLPREDWEGNQVPSPGALKVLRSSEGLKNCIRRALNLHNLDNVQANILTRIVEILDKLEIVSENGEEVSTAFIDEDEERLYQELTFLERSEILKASPIMKAVLDFKRLSKQVSMDLRKYINVKTGKIHTSISQLGTATGRVSCIAEGTQILIPGGHKAIEDIVPNDYVYCYVEKTGKLTLNKVLKVFNNGKKEVVRLYLLSGKYIDLTPDHKVLTEEGWVPTEDLTADKILSAKRIHVESPTNRPEAKVVGFKDEIIERLTIDGNLLSIATDSEKQDEYLGYEEVHYVDPARKLKQVYNLEVQDTHNFIANGICCKNCSGPNLQQISARTSVEIEIKQEDLFRI